MNTSAVDSINQLDVTIQLAGMQFIENSKRSGLRHGGQRANAVAQDPHRTEAAMNVHMIGAGLSAVLLSWASYSVVMAGGEPVRTQAPGWSGRAVSAVQVQVPPILEMGQYYPNDKNPFVPFAQRDVEEQGVTATDETVGKTTDGI